MENFKNWFVSLLGLWILNSFGAELPMVEIIEPRLHAPLLDQPSALGSIFISSPDATTGRLDQQLVEQGVVAWSAANALGGSDGMSMRGFPVSNQGTSQLQASRKYLNGHADIAWHFARDAATVERINLIAGHDATLLGAGSPAGALHYSTKTTHGREFQDLSTSITSNGSIRVIGDAEQHFGALSVRGVAVTEHGGRSVEGVRNNRLVGLLSMTTPLKNGQLRFDTESHQLDTPFPFGTAYTGGRFWLDHSYVDTNRTSADRRYLRNGVYWESPRQEGFQCSAHLQHVASHRQETLVGFYSPVSDSKLGGYYRNLNETNTQGDVGVKFGGRFQTQTLRHQWAAVLQQHTQNRDFSGPQSINEFHLDVQSPTFPASLDSLILRPRDTLESYREQGVGLSNTVRNGVWEFRAGIRQARYEIDSSTARGLAPTSVADADHTSHSWAVGTHITPHQRIWLSQSMSFLPNRGRLGPVINFPS